MVAVIRTAALGAALAMASAGAFAAELRGIARVIDGDGLEIAGRDVRLWGINAPEWDAAGGAASTEHLAAMIAGRPVVCTQAPGQDRYRRFLGVCAVDGRDLAGRMVRDGYATDWPCYSGGAHEREQAAAQAARRGLWRVAGALVTPAGCRRP